MLVVTGPIGVGKTAVLHAADSVLIEAESRHATVELEEIARCWTDAVETSRASFVYRNLAALWANFAAAGASRLLLSALGHRSEVRRISDAVPGAVVTVARLQLRSLCWSSGFVFANQGRRTANSTAHAGGRRISRTSSRRTTSSRPATDRWTR